MPLDLFAGIGVRDHEAARGWYERLFGAEPAFLASDTEAVWELAEHRYVYVEQDHRRAGHAVLTFFVDDLDAFVAGVANRGIEPVRREDYPGGVQKVVFRDADGNEVGIGGARHPER